MSIKKIIAFGSAKGGVGKSSISASVALSLSQHKSIGILDADIYGPNQNILFNINSKNKIVNKNKFIIVKTKGDHRICMSSAIFSLATGIKTKINNFETVNTSFPGFISLIKKNLGAKIEIKKN